MSPESGQSTVRTVLCKQGEVRATCLSFSAAQNKGEDLFMEGLQGKKTRGRFRRSALGVLGSSQQGVVACVKGAFSAEEPRHQKVKEGPELEDVVLDGRA